MDTLPLHVLYTCFALQYSYTKCPAIVKVLFNKYFLTMSVMMRLRVIGSSLLKAQTKGLHEYCVVIAPFGIIPFQDYTNLVTE